MLQIVVFRDEESNQLFFKNVIQESFNVIRMIPGFSRLSRDIHVGTEAVVAIHGAACFEYSFPTFMTRLAPYSGSVEK